MFLSSLRFAFCFAFLVLTYSAAPVWATLPYLTLLFYQRGQVGLTAATELSGMVRLARIPARFQSDVLPDKERLEARKDIDYGWWGIQRSFIQMRARNMFPCLIPVVDTFLLSDEKGGGSSLT